MHSYSEQCLERLQRPTCLSVPNAPSEVLYKRYNFVGLGTFEAGQQGLKGGFDVPDADRNVPPVENMIHVSVNGAPHQARQRRITASSDGWQASGRTSRIDRGASETWASRISSTLPIMNGGSPIRSS